VRSALIEISLVYTAGSLSVCFVDYRTAVPLVGTAVFFIGFGCPRVKGKRGAERRQIGLITFSVKGELFFTKKL
jgi:hypothetical protein